MQVRYCVLLGGHFKSSRTSTDDDMKELFNPSDIDHVKRVQEVNCAKRCITLRVVAVEITTQF